MGNFNELERYFNLGEIMFKFIKTKDPDNNFDHVGIEFTIESDNMSKDDLKELFVDFLKACGYSIKDYEEF